MENVYNDQKFIKLLSNLVPEKYILLDNIDKRAVAVLLEDYVAKIEKRDPLKLIVENNSMEDGSFSVTENTIYISENALENPFLLVSVLFHEGYHCKQFNHLKYFSHFSEEELKLYEYNAAVSKIDGVLSGYVNGDDYGLYIIQPVEYFAYKEDYFRGIKLFSEIEKQFNVKGCVKKYTSYYDVNEKFFDREYYQNQILPIQLEIIKEAKERVERDNGQYENIKKRVDIITANIDYLEDLSKEEASLPFFPLCWDELPLEKKEKVYNTFVRKNKLYYLNPTTELLKKDGLKVLDTILYNHANYLLQLETKTKVDFLKGINEFVFYRRNLNINEISKIQADKDINAIYPFNELKEAFFLFPKSELVYDEYFSNRLEFLMRMDMIFTPGWRKHLSLENKISDLEFQIGLIDRYRKDKENFLKKLGKNQTKEIK